MNILLGMAGSRGFERTGFRKMGEEFYAIICSFSTKLRKKIQKGDPFIPQCFEIFEQGIGKLKPDASQKTEINKLNL